MADLIKKQTKTMISILNEVEAILKSYILKDFESLDDRSHCNAKAPSPGIMSSLSCWRITVT
jgi:hypothetical protein